MKKITLVSLTIFVLFIPFTTLTLFISKILLSIIIILVTFKYVDLKYTLNNLLYFFLTSITLGGFLYYLNVEFSYKNIGMIFFHKGIPINYLFILICGPIFLLIYRKILKDFKSKNALNYIVDLYLPNNEIITLNAFLDSGNSLIDPITRKKVIIVNHKKLNEYIKNNNYYLVPYETVNDSSLLKCIKIKQIHIRDYGTYKDVVVAVVEDKLKNNGIECLLNYRLKEKSL